MSDMISLEASVRPNVGKGAARAARRQQLVPGIIYGAGASPQALTVKFNELFKLLKAGKFKSTLIELKLGDKSEKVICRDVQKDTLRNLPTHVDFLRLSETSRINLFIPVEFKNQATSPGIKRGGVLTVVRPEVELIVNATEIPSQLEVDLNDFELGDTINISNINLPEGAETTIQGRDFVIANIQSPSGLKSAEDEEDSPETEAEEGSEVDVETENNDQN